MLKWKKGTFWKLSKKCSPILKTEDLYSWIFLGISKVRGCRMWMKQCFRTCLYSDWRSHLVASKKVQRHSTKYQGTLRIKNFVIGLSSSIAVSFLKPGYLRSNKCLHAFLILRMVTFSLSLSILSFLLKISMKYSSYFENNDQTQKRRLGIEIEY